MEFSSLKISSIQQNRNHAVQEQTAAYLSKLRKQSSILTQNVKAKIQIMIAHTLNTLQGEIQNGSMQIEQTANPQFLKHRDSLSKSHSSSRSAKSNKKTPKRPFYLSSNPQLIKKSYEKFQSLKSEYSHQNTEKIIKQAEQKVKDWIKSQKTIEKHRKQFIKEIEQGQKIEKQSELAVKRKSLEEKQKNYKQQILWKKLKRNLQKKDSEQKMKDQNISKQLLKTKLPLYAKIEAQFQQRIRQQQFMEKVALKQRKKSSISLNSVSFKSHEKKYLQRTAQRQNNPLQFPKLSPKPRKMKTQIDRESMKTIEPLHKKQFITTFKHDKQENHVHQEEKKIRIREYVQRLKKMSPDLQTLERIKKVREEMGEEGNTKNSNLRKRVQSSTHLNKNIGSKDRKTLSNYYLRELKKNKIYTEMEELKEQESAMQGKISQVLKQTEQTLKHMKTQILNQDQGQRNNTQSPNPQKRTSPNNAIYKSRQLPILQQSRPKYKNYLSELKLKPYKPLNEIQKIKKELKYPNQILKQFTKRSNDIERQMMAKIKEFKNMQRKSKECKYEKNLLKELEIDELYHKNLQMRLACLDV